jgi:methylase of polypeptide subunit release factors
MTHVLTWLENNQQMSRDWITESEIPAPRRVVIADDSLKTESFCQQASEDAAFIWRGDFQAAKHLLNAVQKRIDHRFNSRRTTTHAEIASEFHRHRQTQSHRARLLSRLLICIEEDFSIALKRAPDVHLAITEAISREAGGFVLSLRELLGLIGAHEWRKKGVFVPSLGENIHPHYGVFSPVRGEYLDLVNLAPLSANIELAFEIGTGTGVIGAILAKRGIPKIIATDLDDRAIACAQENLQRLGLVNRVEVIKTDLFPSGKADLVVCNPPWLPARPTSSIERAVYDENSQMLKGFLAGVNEHLHLKGEAWLILSDLAELLDLRKAHELQTWFTQAELEIIACLEKRPYHPKSADSRDALHHARSQEVTRLWRLRRRSSI